MKKATEEKPQMPRLVRKEELLTHFPFSARTLGNLMKLKKDPIPYCKVGKSVLFDLDEVALWWRRWTQRSKSEQEVLEVESTKKTRQGGRITLLQRG